MTDPVVLVAGASGDLGSRIASALVARGAEVRALVRPDASPAALARLHVLGATPVVADPTDVDAVAAVSRGVSVVVSALNGLREVVLDRQSALLDAAVRAGVPPFIPSDFSADFTRTPAGTNRNVDLRREFSGHADRASIQVTSVLNGAFMDMLGAEMPIIQPRLRRVLHWGDADQPMDFTTKDDTAAYTAEAALEPTTPRYLRIARDIAHTLSRTTGRPYRTLRAGSTTSLLTLARVTRYLAPQPGEPFPAWQGMQYLHDMFTGRARLRPLDTARYATLRWTRLRDQLTAGHDAAPL